MSAPTTSPPALLQARLQEFNLLPSRSLHAERAHALLARDGTESAVTSQPAVPRDPAATPGSPANPVTVGGNVTPPPPPQADYPVCKGDVQDRCVNPGEGPKAAKKATRKRAR